MAPRRAKSEPIEKPTTPAFSLYATATPTAGKSVCVMSLSDIATRFGVSRNTVMKWIADGCPVEKRPAGKGDSYELDIRAVIRWTTAQAVEEAKRQVRADLDLDELAGIAGEADDPKELIRIAALQLKFDENRRMLVRRDHALGTMRRAFGLVRQAVMAIPNRALDLFPGLEPEDHRRKYASLNDLCADALTDGAQALKDFDADTTPPAED
jgi:phage terminase Nu1 subunit (DNA packaging protein)